jgi:RecA-family ATPase
MMLTKRLSKVDKDSASPAGQDYEKEVLTYLNSKVVKQVFLKFEEKKPVMKVSISQRISTISVGGNRGGERDTPAEYANIESVLAGIKLNFLIEYILTQGETN